jgi:poly(hydroxyalkanoate) depolymerase family esterase
MLDAARLVRAGRLQEATAAIQDALAKRARPGSTASTPGEPTDFEDSDVIDVEARVLDDAEPATHSPVPPASPLEHPGDAARDDFLWGHFQSPFGARDYKLFVPAAGHDTPRPLVLMLHGCTQDPDDFARGTGMNELASRHGVLVLYPAQAQRANPQRCWNWFKHNHQGRERGEPALLAALVAEVAAKHDVDPRRIYVAGLSAGGAMAAILGDGFPEVFAAVGVHSGLPRGAAKDVHSALAAMSGAAIEPPVAPRANPQSPPTIVFHGDADGTVHPSNGERVIAAGAPGNPSDSHPGCTGAGRAFTRHLHRDHDGNVRAEHWVIHGAGHAWSGGRVEGSHTDPLGPDASAEMLRFFLARVRP